MTKTIHDILDKAKLYINNEKHLDLILDAFNYAKEKHEGQMRKSGDEYYTHPVNVAYILTEYHTGPLTIIAGLLHDVLEDTDTSFEEVAERYTEECAKIIEGVTKLTKLSFTSKDQQIAQNHLKMILAMTEDIRIIVVKLADRLHNMRTIEFMSKEKIEIKCRETMEIFVPLAHRLGMYRLKAELEDISFKYLQPKIYRQIAKALEDTQEQRNIDLGIITADISTHLDSEKIVYDIGGRIKNIHSIAKKMRTKSKNFDEIFDLLALRIKVNTVEECYKVLGIIHHFYKPIPKRFKDYIAIPKANMYQSLHTTILTENGKIFEIQIRTHKMDEVAEIGIAAHWAYKEGRTKQTEQKEIAASLKWYGDMVEQARNEQDFTNTEFLDSIKEELTANIFVFTPNGDVHMLPKGATPIDFAFRIHSKVGEQCIGAVVNNKMVPLDYALDTGDICNIKTSKNSKGPSDSWLAIAKTSHAKSKIRAFLNKRDRDLLMNEGKRKLEEVLPEYDLEKKIDDELVRKYYNTQEINSYDSLLYALGKNLVSPRGVLNKFTGKGEQQRNQMRIVEQINTRVDRKPTNVHGILVEGLDNPKLKLSNCCNPIPGDHIIGYVTKGMGIAIHRNVCHNIKGKEERHINVSWSKSDTGSKYRVMLRISTYHTNTIMVQLINTISATGAVISNINTTKTNDGSNLVKIGIDVKNVDELNKLLVAIRNNPDVYEVERVLKS